MSLNIRIFGYNHDNMYSIWWLQSKLELRSSIVVQILLAQFIKSQYYKHICNCLIVCDQSSAMQAACKVCSCKSCLYMTWYLHAGLPISCTCNVFASYSNTYVQLSEYRLIMVNNNPLLYCASIIQCSQHWLPHVGSASPPTTVKIMVGQLSDHQRNFCTQHVYTKGTARNI